MITSGAGTAGDPYQVTTINPNAVSTCPTQSFPVVADVLPVQRPPALTVTVSYVPLTPKSPATAPSTGR